MKKLTTLILTFFCLLTFNANALDASKAENFVKKVTSEGIEEIVNSPYYPEQGFIKEVCDEETGLSYVVIKLGEKWRRYED